MNQGMELGQIRIDAGRVSPMRSRVGGHKFRPVKRLRVGDLA